MPHSHGDIKTQNNKGTRQIYKATGTHGHVKMRVREEEGGEEVGTKYMMMETELAVIGEHTVQHIGLYT